MLCFWREGVIERRLLEFGDLSGYQRRSGRVAPAWLLGFSAISACSARKLFLLPV
jgi:hypothetical protein